jgi:hypothetical protein
MLEMLNPTDMLCEYRHYRLCYMAKNLHKQTMRHLGAVPSQKSTLRRRQGYAQSRQDEVSSPGVERHIMMEKVV